MTSKTWSSWPYSTRCTTNSNSMSLGERVKDLLQDPGVFTHDVLKYRLQQGSVLGLLEFVVYIHTCHHSRVAKPIHCAQNVKTARLCTEFNKSINNIFLICHISKMAAIDLESSTWVKYWNMLWFLWKLCQIVCLVITIQKRYSLMHLRCLAFKLHKIIGQRSFQICTGSQNLKLLRFWWIIPQIVCINADSEKRIVLYTSEALIVTYDL